MKKALGLLVFSVLFVLATTVSTRAEIIDSGTCGANLTWSVDDSMTLSISGTGDMYNYGFTVNQQVTTAPWKTYKGRIEKIEINDGVSSICDYAFMNMMNNSVCSELHLPNSLRTIGSHAFCNCASLSGVLIIPEGVTEIKNSAFACAYQSLNGNNNVGTVSLPSTLRRIEHHIFSGCAFTGNIIIPASVEEMVTRTTDGYDYANFGFINNIEKVINHSSVPCLLISQSPTGGMQNEYWYLEGDETQTKIISIANGTAIHRPNNNNSNNETIEIIEEQNEESYEEQHEDSNKSELPYGTVKCGNGGKGNGGKDAIDVKVLTPEQRDTTNQNAFAKYYFKNRSFDTIFSYNVYPPYGVNNGYKNSTRIIYWADTGLKQGDEVYAVWYCQSSKKGAQMIKCDIDANGIVSIRIPQIGDMSTITLIKVK